MLWQTRVGGCLTVGLNVAKTGPIHSKFFVRASPEAAVGGEEGLHEHGVGVDVVGEPLHQLDEGGALDEGHARALLLVLEDNVLVRVDLGELVLVCGGQVEVTTTGCPMRSWAGFGPQSTQPRYTTIRDTLYFGQYNKDCYLRAEI